MEKKPSISRNLLVIIIVVALIAVVAIIAATQKRELNPTLGTLEADPTQPPVVTEEATLEVTDAPVAADPTDAPETTAATEVPASTEVAPASPETTLEPARAFLVVTVAGAMYEPIPLYEAGRYTITRGELVNVIEVTTDSVMMYQSSCDNQDCVEQGVVSLENRQDRVLQNMIICLPNEVVLELYTPDEVAQLLLSMIGYTGEETDE